jgi:hypothetical protein
MYGDCGRYSTGVLHRPLLTVSSSPLDNGRRTLPLPAGQMPAITRSSELLPEPFLPVIIVCMFLYTTRQTEH